ncbi:hypothetical protein [Glycomyces paridis]|uniref:Uncharacterized protein n=1 Tax=Glycomyces paridis TaxID=2126555 RepID=A0A4S8PDV9_9ACTN|nr:hypothetical protein [Glycomyces paridis]THV26494.1 hypothetical protein E9998_18220 [Glycomyces paridis]
MSDAPNEDSLTKGDERLDSKQSEKRRRREEARQREREQRRPLVRAAAVCGSVAVAGLALAAGLSLMEFADAALWITGPAGIAVLAFVAILLLIERMKTRKKDRMGAAGWIGLSLAVLSGISLITAFASFLGSGGLVPVAAGVAIVSSVLAFGALGSEFLKDVEGGNDNNTVVQSMNDISNNHN